MKKLKLQMQMTVDGFRCRTKWRTRLDDMELE